jgi:hypothetical protein
MVGNHPEEGLKYLFNVEEPVKGNQMKVQDALNDMNLEFYELGVDVNFNYWKELAT